MMKLEAVKRFDDTEVDALWSTDFGGSLFNAYTAQCPNQRLFSSRLFVVRRMLRAMLDAEAELNAQRDQR